MHPSAAEYLLAYSGPALQTIILAVMIRRRLRPQFPIFFTYTLFVMASSIVQNVAHEFVSPTQYTIVSLVNSAVSICLAFCVFYEVFRHVLKPYSAITDLSRLLFGWAGLFLLVAALTTTLGSGSLGLNGICTVFVLFERVARLMECGLLFLLLIFETRLGLSWRNYAMSIALGLGSYSAVDLISSLLRTAVADRWYMAAALISPVCYALVLIGWAINFAFPEPARKNALESPSRLIFQRWNETLMSSPLVAQRAQLATASMESFIPGVEKTVDRILAKKMVN